VQSSNHPQISSQVQEIPHQTRAPIPDALSPPAKAQPSTTRSLTTQPLGHTTSTSVEYSSSHSEVCVFSCQHYYYSISQFSDFGWN